MSVNSFRNKSARLSDPLKNLPVSRGLLFGAIIIFALLAFEFFNFSTTHFALEDLLGGLSFAGVAWATILAFAFCAIDFAGIARLFTPEQGQDEPAEVWYLFGAWLLAATMNAILTWWGVSIAILSHESLGNAVMDRTTLLKAVPIFVAAMVWLSRILIIGTFSVAGNRLFSQSDRPTARPTGAARSFSRPAPSSSRPQNGNRHRPAPKPAPPVRPEPSYHPVSMSGQGSGRDQERS
ncbi:MAG: hypothetical protein R3335_09400 [Anaerolineales bacterium]|nr:hypothetical protein [Anaerolineales bacterium]